MQRISRLRSPVDLVEAVIFPSSAIAIGYEPYSIATADVRVQAGIIVRETSDAIYLSFFTRDADGSPNDSEHKMSLPPSLFSMFVVLTCVLFQFSMRITAAERMGSRFAYLDELNPFYPHADFPRLTTPMWVGDEGVDAVILLSVDDVPSQSRRHRATNDA